ncbi:hypothetical protein GXM_04705 [Nostoc sphaeroides CCNUC1]|uniref:Uncharacterized protein n=1 Tax=Nostoc sphaeroides CCNUC1 TaxID=2653204 RepID=A0A5P8W3A4_9NOSO|nr:hypothetical protein GXM_04705 [Nostoc sphaeroides CCNUC1]
MKAWATRSVSDFPAGKAVKLRATQNIISACKLNGSVKLYRNFILIV